MTSKTSMNIMLWGESGMTMNTDGELIHTMKVKTVYYIWKIPIWKTTKYIDGTHDELKERKKNGDTAWSEPPRIRVSYPF